MRELGFDYDPSTAGSSVRFDPPNPNDRVSTWDDGLYHILICIYSVDNVPQTSVTTSIRLISSLILLILAAHPDSTLYAYKIKEYRDKLAEYYDWTPDKFQKALDEVRARSNKD